MRSDTCIEQTGLERALGQRRRELRGSALPAGLVIVIPDAGAAMLMALCAQYGFHTGELYFPDCARASGPATSTSRA